MKRLLSISAFLVVVLFATSLAFAADMSVGAWTYSGPGTTSLTQSGSDGILFSYDLEHGAHYGQTWTVSSVSATTQQFVYYWDYWYWHSWYQVQARLTAYAQQPDGTVQTVTLYYGSGDGHGVHNPDGLSSLHIHAGYEFGFRIYGCNWDWADYLRGRLTIVEAEVEFPAAPAIAARILEANGISPKYGSGKDGGNYIADVARLMDGTDFMSQPKAIWEDDTVFVNKAYWDAVWDYLRDQGLSVNEPPEGYELVALAQ